MTTPEQKTFASVTLTPDEEWTELHAHLPDPSIWPIIIALGISVLLTGIVINLLVILIGLAIFAFGLGGWIYQDIMVSLRQDEHGHH
ncbi:MAG: cytochrome c oxidase subunit 4 [Chloroflexaceae bacterium]|nr:cytochrome c oxidase subunit 4 [Chloroflexaceae bacterium]NJL33279.1 cytochrome c oxidase subunit 4 [Chloroflexaceae bacterium]NJO04472.1 cytochrome c oxidase subunit 4 [Chloroflexaceae bacterium]